MKKIQEHKCGFEAREKLGDSYWQDPEWKKVSELRKQGKNLEANDLVFKIRDKWCLD